MTFSVTLLQIDEDSAVFVVLTAGECKYSLSFILPADKLQLQSPSKNIYNPVTHLSASAHLLLLTHTESLSSQQLKSYTKCRTLI